jgi:hypothetical protein
MLRVFGGSTAFSWGVADDQTIASHLQVFLEAQSARAAKVDNFGSSWYFSTQERIRFCNLLAEDVVLNVAIFIDGSNDFVHSSGEPEFTDELLGALQDDRAIHERLSKGRLVPYF